MCQTRKSDRQEWQSLVVLNWTKIFLNGTNISFLKFICGILNRGVANSFWNHVNQISSRQMYFQYIYSNLWKVKVFIGNIYSLKSNTYFWGTVMFVQNGLLYLIVTKHKLTVCLQPDTVLIICHRCQQHKGNWWQICRQCRWYRQQFATGVIETGGKFATGVVDTGGAPWLANISAHFQKNSKRS